MVVTPRKTRAPPPPPQTKTHKTLTHNKLHTTNYTQKIANKARLTKTDPFSARTGPESIKNEIKMCPKKQF